MFVEGMLLVGIGMVLANTVDNSEHNMRRFFPPAASWAGWLYGIRIAAAAQIAVAALLGLGWLLIIVNVLAFLATFSYIDVEGVGRTEQQTLRFYKYKVLSAVVVYVGFLLVLTL